MYFRVWNLNTGECRILPRGEAGIFAMYCMREFYFVEDMQGKELKTQF